MADPNVEELNALTYYEVYPKSIEDNFFLAAPLLAYFRDHCLVPFTGGTWMQAIFRYAPLIGGFYAPGSSFNITKRTTMAALQFDTRYLYVSIPEYKEEIQVENKGEYAVASLLEADMQNGVDTINAIVAVALALNSVPVFCGNGATGAAGPITYSTLEEAYQDATIGRKEPNLGVGNKAVIAYIKEKLVVQQRFQQERDPVWGVTGFRLNNS